MDNIETNGSLKDVPSALKLGDIEKQELCDSDTDTTNMRSQERISTVRDAVADSMEEESSPSRNSDIAKVVAGKDRGNLDRTESNISIIPDGGLQAWLVVAGSFFLFFNSWSVLLNLLKLIILLHR